MTLDEIIIEAVKAYKEEFMERPEEYVHGDYISFLSERIRKAVQRRDEYWVEHLQAHRKHCTSQGNKELTKAKKTITL